MQDLTKQTANLTIQHRTSKALILIQLHCHFLYHRGIESLSRRLMVALSRHFTVHFTDLSRNLVESEVPHEKLLVHPSTADGRPNPYSVARIEEGVPTS